MKLTYNWILKHLSKHLSIDEITNALNNLSIEIDSICKISGKNYYLAEVINKKSYTDQLNIVTVKYKNNEEKDLICGADNVKIGMYTILITEGGFLPNGIEIKSRNIKGFISSGMLLSYEELGLKHLHFNGIINEKKEFLEELIKEDYIINISLPANRIDISSIMGLSREIGNYYNISLKPFNLNMDNVNSNKNLVENNIKVNIEENTTSNFQTLLIKNIKIKNNYNEITSLLCKITTLNHLPIININIFIMKDLGIPLHIYDANTIKELYVNFVTDEEKSKEFITLKEENLLLKSNDIVIKNEKKEVIVLGGLIGGNKYKVTENTNNILIEVGIFNREYLIPTSIRLNINTDSSYYNKRGINYNNFLITLNYIKNFIDGDYSKINIIKDSPKVIEEIFLSYEKFYRISGISVSLDRIKNILEQYEYKVKIINKGSDNNLNDEMGLMITPPLWKCHILSDGSIIEDIIRVSNLEIERKSININPFNDKKEKNIEEIFYENVYKIKTYLTSVGLHEIITYSFNKIGSLQLSNPIISDKKFFRETLVDDMEENLITLFKKKDYMSYEYGYFEISKVFKKKEEKVIEYNNLSIGVLKEIYHYGFGSMETFLKNILLNIGYMNNLKIILKDDGVINKINIYVNGFINGYIKIFEEYFILEIENLEKLMKKEISIKKRNYEEKDINFSVRDYSFIYEKDFNNIENALLKIKNITFSLFDVFKNSYTIRFKIIHEELLTKEEEILRELEVLKVVFR
jgi:phenylalanyl-tRNA synthetase beta chain